MIDKKVMVSIARNLLGSLVLNSNTSRVDLHVVLAIMFGAWKIIGVKTSVLGSVCGDRTKW